MVQAGQDELDWSRGREMVIARRVGQAGRALRVLVSLELTSS